MRVSKCTTVVHNMAQSSSDYLPSEPVDNHHCSLLRCSYLLSATWGGGGRAPKSKIISFKAQQSMHKHIQPANRLLLYLDH